MHNIIQCQVCFCVNLYCFNESESFSTNENCPNLSILKSSYPKDTHPDPPSGLSSAPPKEKTNNEKTNRLDGSHCKQSLGPLEACTTAPHTLLGLGTSSTAPIALSSTQACFSLLANQLGRHQSFPFHKISTATNEMKIGGRK